jgi:iron/zinc/copper transport system permease protein
MHWLTDPFHAEFMQRAFLAAIIIGIVAPVVGTWVVLRRMANLGDAMSHGTLAGVGIAYAAGVNVLFGAMGAGLVIALLLLTFSSNRRLGQETIITVIGTAFFALGVVVISRLDTGVELTHFLFGRVLTVQWSDIWLNLALGTAAVLVVALMFGELRLATFDHVQAEQVGVRVELVQGVLVMLLAVVVVISLRAVGTVMTVTMLVTPAATARLVARTLRQMTLWGVAFGVGEGVVGLMISYHLSSAPGRMPHHHRPLG